MKMEYIEFKAGEKFAGKGADKSPSHDSFCDAGLLIPDDVIVIDIDSLPKEITESMIKKFNLNTMIVETGRGHHLWFKKPKGMRKVKKDSFNSLGVEFEYKDCNNTSRGITIKQNGVMRTIRNAGTLQELPEFLAPLSKVKESLLGLSDGDRTDNKLYAHKFKIMYLSNWKQVMYFINDYIIEYPFDKDDIDRITRDEEVTVTSSKTHYDVAIELINKLNIVRYSKVIYVYDGKRYVVSEELKRVIAQHLRGQRTEYQNEVIKQIELYAEDVADRKGGFDIKFKNGILRDGTFYEIDSHEFTPHYIDWKYNDEQEAVEILDYFLNNISSGFKGQEAEQEYKDLLLEMVAHTLITNINIKQNKAFQKVFFIAGDGGNGKGALFRLIQTLLGKGNYRTNKLEKLSDDRFIYGMKGALANLGNDIEDQAIDSKTMSNLKSISSGDEIEVRALYGMPITETITATQIFTTNHILKSFEKGNAWERRAVWCPMFAPPEREFKNFYEQLLSDESIEYFLLLVMKAYFRLMENGKFTRSKKVTEFTSDYHIENNGTLEFLSFMEREDIVGKRTPEVYEEYETWANENGIKLQSQKILKDTVLKEFDLVIKGKMVNGKVAKVYQEK
ncbi:DUF5906 domain-containing protein [Bacillus sp. AFS017336]|uniref:DUF5906 domain-containing protein n=1 Tax=Bacillus sp. AFS017336 TaxID=2033489 RepID=UPI000BEF5315|nr:DUF5906 domain-containing protein [Bacillus sp. AFS017336]PEL03941.1 DNA primase [Bacillus sp. AFS017336]